VIKFWISSDKIRGRVFIPKFYNPEVLARLDQLGGTHKCLRIGDLVDAGVLEVTTGDEIGKAAYGTGDIPFVRTSDIANWEIKAAPKQGVSQEIYDEYVGGQDVKEGDILLVRDGTYLIGVNCFVTKLDRQLLYQSHLLKIRVLDQERLDPRLLFLALNSGLVQIQLRSFQFTADIIDTIGRRFLDAIIPIPKNSALCRDLSTRTDSALKARMKGKAFIKHCPVLMKSVLRTGSTEPISAFASASDEDLQAMLKQETVTSEFGGFEHFWLMSDAVRDLILMPRYYDPSITQELKDLSTNCDLVTMAELRDQEVLEYHTGDEVGKLAYGTGNIPFIRTSDFSNWEISHNPKQGVSAAIYHEYRESEDVQAEDLLLVRDGTYLVGSSCMITREDAVALYCGGLIKIRALDRARLDPHLLLGLLNSYIVRRQFRTKQFTRDVIDTLGNRLDEVVIPIPKNAALRKAIALAVNTVIDSRIDARHAIEVLALEVEGLAPAASLATRRRSN
jgi:hypothetical protein